MNNALSLASPVHVKWVYQAYPIIPLGRNKRQAHKQLSCTWDRQKTCQPCREPHVSRTGYNTASTKARRRHEHFACDMWQSYSRTTHIVSTAPIPHPPKSAAPNRQFSQQSKILGRCLVLITHSQEKLGIAAIGVGDRRAVWTSKAHGGGEDDTQHTYARRYAFDNDG